MKIKDYLFIEANDACAICGIKGTDNLTIHHIDNKKNNKYDNLIVLCRNCHCKFHEKKGITKKYIKSTKRRLIIKTLTSFGVNAIKISYRNGYGVTAMPFLLYHLIDLGLMKQKEIISNITDGSKSVASEALFEITNEGKKLYEKWFK